MEWSLISEGIYNHRKTLRSLAMAERVPKYPKANIDTELDGDINWKSPVRKMISSLNLQCLGISNDLEYLVGLPSSINGFPLLTNFSSRSFGG